MTRHSRRRSKRSSARRERSRSGRKSSVGRGRKAQTSSYQVEVPALKRGLDRSLVSPQMISALLLVVAGWLLYWFSNADVFYTRGLQVTGNERVPEAELMAISGLEGVNIFWVDTYAVEQVIEALPDIVSADVRCSLPADCVIDLAERPALFVWRQGDAQVWIAPDGMVLPARGDLPDALVLNAVGSTALKPGDNLDLTLVAAVEELERLQPDVRRYEYSDQYGLSFRNPSDWLIRLGDGREIVTKLNLVQALTDYLSSQDIAPAFVDVRFPEAPYYSE